MGWFSEQAFATLLYVDDGIFIELRRNYRMEACTFQWDQFAYGLIGKTAINMDKLGAEGVWHHEHVILGFLRSAENLAITLPEAKLAGAHVLFGELLKRKHTTMLTAQQIQQARTHGTLSPH